MLADGNGNFTFRSLRSGSYTVVVEGGDFFETTRETLYIESHHYRRANKRRDRSSSRPYTVQVYLRDASRRARR